MASASAERRTSFSNLVPQSSQEYSKMGIRSDYQLRVAKCNCCGVRARKNEVMFELEKSKACSNTARSAIDAEWLVRLATLETCALRSVIAGGPAEPRT